MKSSYRIFLFASLLCVFASLTSGQENGELKFWEKPSPDKPIAFDELLEKTAETFADPENGEIRFLVELSDRKYRKQWIVDFTPGGPVEMPEGQDEIKTTIHSSTGDVVEFSSKVTSVDIQTLGAFRIKTGKQKGKWDRKSLQGQEVNVPEDFLLLGFDRVAQFALKLAEYEATHGRMALSTGPNPFPFEQVEATRVEMMKRGITSDHVKPIFGFGPSLNSFLALIQSTPGISKILMSIVDKPSLFSMISKGINVSFHNHGRGVAAVKPEEWYLEPERSCYRIPISLSLNGNIAVEFILIVTSPESPYDLTGGVVGMEVYTPKDLDKWMVVTLLHS